MLQLSFIEILFRKNATNDFVISMNDIMQSAENEVKNVINKHSFNSEKNRIKKSKQLKRQL